MKLNFSKILKLMLLFLLTLGISTLSLTNVPLGAAVQVSPEIYSAIVQIATFAKDGTFKKAGTGTIISKDGYILTVSHVIRDAERSCERAEGPLADFFVILVTEDPKQPPRPRYVADYETDKTELDLALLKVRRVLLEDIKDLNELKEIVRTKGPESLKVEELDEELPFLKLGDSEEVQLGDAIRLMGYPKLEWYPPTTLGQADGIISNFYDWPNFLFIKAQADVGMSGGPVLDKDDRLIGVLCGAEPAELPGTYRYKIRPMHLALKENIITLEILPPYPPEIIDIKFPIEIQADRTPYSGNIKFRDFNGDLKLVQFRVKKGIATVSPTEISESELEQFRGKIKGEIPFKVESNEPQKQVVTIEVILSDLQKQSTSRDFSFRTLPSPQAPKVYIAFPDQIFADGRKNEGTVAFEDPDGDIVNASFVIVKALDKEAIRLEPGWNFDPNVPGQKTGSFSYSVSTIVPQEVGLAVILTDAKGKEGRVEKIFRAVPIPGSKPVLHVSQPKDFALGFTWEMMEVAPLAPQSITILNSGGQEVTWKAQLKNDVPWLRLEPQSGSLLPGQETQITVKIDTSMIGVAGIYPRVVILIEAPGAAESPREFSVDLVAVPQLTFPEIRKIVEQVPADSCLTLFVPEKTYETDEESLEIEDKCLTLRGASENAVFVGRPYRDILQVKGQAKVTLQGLTIQGQVGLTGILIEDATDVTVENILIRGSMLVGLHVKGGATEKVTIKDVEIVDTMGTGILVEDRPEIKINNTKISRATEGIWVKGRGTVIISNTTISDGDIGIQVEGLATVAVLNSNVSQNRKGIEARDKANVSIGSKTSVTKHKRAGIEVRGHATVSLLDITISHNGGNGVLLAEQASATIWDTYILNNGVWGVAFWIEPCQGPIARNAQFKGEVSGRGNVIPGKDEPNGNKKGDLCPKDYSWPPDFIKKK